MAELLARSGMHSLGTVVGRSGLHNKGVEIPTVCRDVLDCRDQGALDFSTFINYGAHFYLLEP